ncbi:hypothetical protein [Tenacibaculum finnmarkense]|uniref:hypothetical protein n=1 Tax=Tenacibaculum finnmarkense TaxID=2781243 RepID=UPI00187B9210|nr:hypothetical protein [Tenacibaculum finnmarkense]MBE7659683.1 hypothetical protein [Tenacibaculum finnmarkense genomovar finnmarkense]MBE7691885.1 hypothetical protein [Tenacibaculum finnmarkense genomovar finnmarkense]MCD8401608.1 hypothetical protein [Tenacibaculum finnmarkense genomovar finnmarkense]MCD8412684.1 hypothetical protein [Tenacibaculum finnmarkense genomovar ulcerans]MCD8446323.1 hypothetical protein [Tenacibaculum finnmarkense genomovar finnmarkense]
MTLDKLLIEFYAKNGIPKDGGVDDDTFEFKVFGLKINLPNPKFRREALYIHDIQHILNDCDTSWKGEGFIAGWEISTGIWKYFKLGFLSLWAMGYSLWIYPKSVLNGFKKGINEIGIIDLKISKSNFMKMQYSELVRITKKEKIRKMNVLQWTKFLFWVITSQIIFLFPLIAIAIGLTFIMK